jgi:hypothetical protein
MDYGDVGPGPAARDTILGTGANRIRPVTLRAMTASAALIGMGGRLMGWALRESTGASFAAIEFYDGASTGGTLIAPINIGQGGFLTFYYGDLGIDVESGIYVNVVAGSMDVTCYYRFDTGEY